MDKKSSMSRIERQKREKVLRFSIRKYSFGAASVAVAALMFLGARVVSADSVTPVDQPHVEALTQDTSPLASQDKEEPASSVKVDTAVASQLVTQLKDQLHVKEAANTDLLVAAKEELVKAEQTLADSKVSQEEVDALVARLTNVLDQLRAVETPQVKEDKNGESTQEATPEIKPEVAKPTPEISAKSEETSENTNAEQLEKAKASLKLSIERLEQTIAQTPENELTREILEKAIAQVAVAKSAFGGVEVSLRDVEDMNRVIKRNESSVMIARNRLTSGSHDPRNGQSMGEGTQFRAYTATSSSGALKNVRYFASVDKRTNGGRDTKNDDPEFTEKKTVIKAKYEQNSSGKWMVYDVYFNNNGVAMADKSYSQHYYFQPPFNIMDGSNRVENLTFTRYRNVDQNPNRKLSDGDGKFQKVGETAVISNPWEQKTKIFPGDRRATYDPQGVSRPNQKWQVFKNNQNDQYLDKIVKRTDGSYTGGVSYTLGLEVGKEDLDYAIHMTARVKLKDNVTETEAGNGNVYAASVTTGRTTNQSYIVGSQGTSLQADPDAPKDPIKGLTVTKTVGDDAGDPINPVSSGYVKHGKNGTFPAGMNWTWKDNKSPSTAEAGVFKYKSIATYKDGSSSEDKNSGSDGTVTLNVKPKQPTIETSVENKKGLPNQQITVNVGNGVPDGSTVKLYDGDRVIGTGVTKGQTATVTVAEALPGNPIKAETVVTNANGTVTSDKSNPVTPTEVPDNQPPTLEISPANQTVVEGQTVTFTVTARDDKHVNFDPSDLTTKYSSRLITGNVSATPVTETDTEKTRRITITTTAEDVGKTNTITFKATDNAGHEAKPVTFTFNVTPRDTTPPKIYWLKDDGTRQELGYTHAAGQNVVIPLYRGDAVNTRLITVDDSGKVTDFRLENLQSGFNFTPVSGTATEESPLGQNVTGKVGLEVKKGKYTARAISTDGTNSTTGYFVFDIHEQAEKYPLEGKTETVTVGDSLKTWNGRVDSNQYTEAPKGRGVGVEWGWKGEAPKVVQDTAGVFKYTATATHPDKSVAESNPQVTIIVKPKAPTIETDLTGKAEVPNTEVVVNVHDGVKDGSTVTLYSPEGRAIGTGTVTNGKAKITGTIPVGNITAKTTVQTPGQPNVESELSPIKVATKIAETEKPGKIEITQQPNGNAIVTPKKPDGSTYPPKTTVEIPGENGTPIKVTIGDNGSGEVPNDKLPKKDVPGTGTVTEPNKKPSQPVDVTTPARKTPTIELKPDPKTGDVTVTPQRPGGGTYPPGTKVEIPGEDGPITVTIGEDGKGKVPNDKLPKKDVPGTGKITEPGKPAVEVPDVTTPAKVTPETPETEKPGKIEITQQPNGNAIVTPKKPDGSTYPPKTTVEIPGENGTPIKVTIGDNGSGEVPNDKLPKKDVPGTGTVTEPNKKPSQPVDVTTPARKTPTIELKPDPKTGDVTVTPQRPGGGTYPPGTKVEIPGEDGPITVTIGEDGKGKVPNDKLPKKDVPGTGKITEPGKPAVEVPDVTTPAKVTPETPETEKPGKIEITQQPNGNAIVTPKKPDGSTYPPKTTVEIPGEDGPITVTIGDNGSGEVPNDKLPKKDVPGTGTVTEPNKKPSQPVDVTTPARKTPTIELKPDPKTGDVTVTPQRPGGGTYPPKTTVEIPGEDGPITVTIGDNGSGEVPNDKLPKKDVPGTGTVTEPNKKPSQPVDVTTPARKTPTIELKPDPKTGDVTVTPQRPGGGTYPPGTTVEIPGEDGPITVTIGEDGKGKVPNDKLPKKDVPGTGKITEPGKPAVEVPDVTTPAKVTPETPETEKPGKIEITQQPNGNAIVTPKKPDGSTYPPKTTVEIPGEDGPITVTIGDNGSGEVPNDKLPKKDVPGTGTVTEPNKKPSQPVDVTTPARKTPTIELKPDPKTGDVTVTPQRPGGGTYPPGTKVEIPGEDGPITVTIGEDGKGKVPNDKLPKKDVPGTGKITEPGKPAVEVPDVTTPAKVTPETPETEKPGKIEITQQPNGNAIVTPKKPDGSTYPPKTTVEIPGEDGPITVTIGDNGSGEVPNDKLPKKDVPGTGTVTEPNKKPSQPVDVTTPARKTPTIELKPDPKTGDVTVTPQRPGGGTYPPGTKVEIPGEDGPITVTIGEDGKGKVPNDKLPKKDVPGTGKITEPGKPAVEVPDVTTPAKVTPETPETEKPGKIEITQQPNGNAIVTPKKPDGSTYPPKTTVEIPGEDGPITVTIGDNGSGEVPNDKLPKKDVPGTGTVTEPNKKPSQPVDVTTPARKTPTIELKPDPKTGDVTVTPQRPGGGTYPPKTTVEIPGEDGPITVTIGDNGSGEVPNDKLPKKDVPGTGTVTEPNKKPSQPVDVTTPARKTPTIELKPDPKTGDVTVTPQRPGGGTYPPGTKVEIPGEDGPITVTIGEDGKGKVPNDKLPKKDVPGTGKITEPGKPAVEVPDVTTPAKVTPETPETEKPGKIEITQQPNGNAIVTPKKPDGSTYPPKTTVEIPGEDGPITVTIGDNGSGEVPNDKLPKKDVPGTGTVTEPNKKPSQPVDVTTPARKTPTIELKPDPKTGDVTVTPQRPGGGTYPPGTKVEIPGEDGPITVTIGEDGKGKVPNDKLPKKDVPGTGKITEPGKPAVEVPDVTTPAKVTPETPETEKPGKIEITQQPNGNAIVTPKKPDGSTYPPKTTVEIPGEDGPITVTIGDNGSGEVPNDKLPKKDVPGTGTVTEPNKKPSQPVDVTTPARKTPTIELKPDPKTGDVTVTPQRPGGGTYPPGTKVEIPGEDGPITVTIGEDGKGKVPNDKLPKKDVPGTGKITEPGKPAVEVPDVTTPAKVTPETPETEKPGKIEITQQPNGNAIVTPKKPDGSTYPPKTTVEIPGEDGPITVTIGDNGSGEVPNDKLPKKDVPGTGTVTEPNKKPSQPVDVTTPAQKTPTLDVEQDPKTGDITVTPKKPDGSTYPPGTTVEIPGEDGNPITVTIGEDGKGKVPNDKLPKKDVPGTGKITEPGKPAVEVPVTTPGKVTPNTPTTETPSEIEITRKPNGDAIVTPKKPDGSTYPSGSKVVIPGENNTPIEVTIGDNGSGEVPNDKLPKKDVPGTGTVTEPNKKPSQPVDVTTPAQKTPTLDVEQDPKTGDITVTPKKPDGSTYPPGTTVEIPGEDGNPITVTIGEDGKGKVPNDKLPKKDVPGTGKITEPGKPAVEVPVTTPGKVTPNTPTTETPSEIEITRKPNGDAIVTPKKPDGSTYPSGSKVVIPGENNTPIEVTIGDNGSGEVPNDKLPKKDVPGTGTVTEPNKKPSQPVDVTTPAQKTPTLDVEQDPKTGDITVTPKKPDGSTYPPGTTVEIPGEDGNPITVTIGEDGKGKVPNDKLPKKDVPGTGKITEPGKPAVEVPVTTPGKVTPNTPTTETPSEIEITRKPNGDAIVTPKKPDGSTYPSGSKVVIPGENNTPIEVTIGDNGSGEVPNDKLPKKDVPGTGTVTEPNKKPSQPVDVTTPAQKTPTLDVEQDPKTGDITVTPKKPDGSTYPPGTTVEIPGEDGNPITVTIGEDGKGKVPNDKLPKKDVPGTGKITEPGKPAVEVPVTTPGKVTPNTPTTETPSEIEITRKPNGDAIVTPKKPDGSTYPSGSKVVIPGENNTPIEVTIGDNGSGEVPNDKLPKKDVPGTGTVTEPNKKPSQPVDVTTPAQKTPTLDVEQDPKTGDITVTPKKPDGSTYPPGTTVEIPGEDGNPITVTIGEDGKGKVPNDKLPKKDVPGTGKITEPGKPAVEVPVTTPGKVTPNTPTTETPSEIEITRKPNGDAIVTPKKPDGSTYPSGSKVVIPGENNTPIEVTIGDNGSGEVPNDKLPKKDVPGKGTVTEPNKKPSQPVDVTTPAQKTPTLDVEQDPKTGDITVTPKKPDGSTYPPGTTVEIPGEDGNPITVTIGEDGKGKVPNDKLPKKDVPGTGKITEPGKPAVEVPVTTPGKVTPNTPTTETPVAPVTPDTNGAKSNDSQKVLPNTGTESNATLASLGLLGILGGLGLALGKKKED